ncbi:hypothetical protein C8R43DRAFT_1152306 [Mycena crocata]|nr:hypothetical protein C8R43DRAFT_1152306 [Mycena crocata]
MATHNQETSQVSGSSLNVSQAWQSCTDSSKTEAMSGSSREHEMSLLEAEIAWHYAQIAALKAKRNSLAPICNLPNELLCRIFTLYAVESDTLFNLKWSQIMYVCHHWHDLAIATQPLWAYVDLDWGTHHIERFYEQLDRSGAAPLTLRIKSYDMTGLQGLEAHGEAKKIYDLIGGLTARDFPVLSSLDLNPSYKRDELPERFVEALPDEIFDGRMPQLQELVLHDIALPWRSLSGLTSLCLTDCGDSSSLPHTFGVVLATLQECPQLHTLKLEQSIPPPPADQNHSTVDLPALEWIRLRGNATICAATLNHLRFPPNTSVHIFPYGVHAGPDISELLIPLRKHFRAPAAPVPRLVHVDGSVGPQLSHYTTSLFYDTASPDPSNAYSAQCPFLLNCHPMNEAELRHIMTKILKAVPVESITHVDARTITMTSASWKTALKLLPALEAVYLSQWGDIPNNFLAALSQFEQLNPKHQNFSRLRHVNLRVLSRRRFRVVSGDQEVSEDFVAVLLTPLQTYLRAALDNGNALQVLELEDQDYCLAKHESELDKLFPLIEDEMVWNDVVYDPAKRKAKREAKEIKRREFFLKHGIEWST